jgi:hypothetical protein
MNHMVDETNTDNSNTELVDMDDLDSFENDFFQHKPKEAEPEEVAENEDDALATSEDTEAEEAGEPTEDEDSEVEEEAPEEEPKPKAKSKKSAKERIDEITAEKYDLRRQLDEALRKLESRSTEEDKPKEPESVREMLSVDAPNPDAEDADGEPLYPLGEFDPKFIRDLTKFTIQQETKALREEQEKEAEAKRIKETQEVLSEEWNSKLTEFEKEQPDVRDSIKEMVSVFSGIEPSYGEYLAATIMGADNGPEVMYYLSQNIGEAQKIVASGPAAATLAIGRLQARLEKAPEEKRNVSKVSAAAPPPVNRTRGQGGKFSVSSDTDDLDAFEREFFKR